MLDFYRQYLQSDFVIPDTLISIKDEIKSFGIPEIEGTNLSVLLKDENIPKEL